METFEVGSFLKCSMGGRIGAFVCYSYCPDLNIGLAMVVSGGRRCLWPLSKVTQVNL